jgi:DsbC/DsbD-like thiol-disulfide interchange protein
MMNREKVLSARCSMLSFLKLRAGLCLLVAWMALGNERAEAQTGLTLQLVPETTAIVPGQPFRVGLFIQHEKEWHTYWRQPGIVGVPTSLRWELPEGFTAGELEFPEPESVLMFHIKAQGYERDVLLQTEIRPPADLRPGDKITLHTKATWMCCGNTCHPGHMGFSLEMPVAAKSTPDPKWQPLFEKERAAYPRPSDAWTSTAVEDGLKMTLTLSPTSGARAFTADEKILFFTEDGWINSDEPQPQKLNPDGGLTLHLTRADVFLGKTIPDRLQGLLQREGGWVKGETWRSLSIAPEIQRKQPAK